MKFRSIGLIFFIILTAILTTGCIEIEEEITINADGSFLLEVTYAMKEVEAAELFALVNYHKKFEPNIVSDSERFWKDSDPNPFDFNSVNMSNEFTVYQAQGVTATVVRTEIAKQHRFMFLSVTFSDLEKVQESEIFEDKAFMLFLPQPTLAITKDGDSYNVALSIADDPVSQKHRADAPDSGLISGFSAKVLNTSLLRNDCEVMVSSWIFNAF